MLQLRFTGNTKPPMWLVAPKYTFGSHHDCDCVLTQRNIEPLHAEISVEGDVISLIKTATNGILSVNNIPVTKEIALQPGDKITIGTVFIQVVDPKQESAKKAMLTSTEATQMRTAESTASDDILWQLRPLNTTLAKSENIALAGSMLLGRSKECDICIPATHLSRKHAKFTVIGEILTVEDLNSSNGTFVNGARIEYVTLKYGDEIGFDTLKFRVEGASQKEEVTTLRSALDDTQIRQAVTPEHIQRRATTAPVRKAPPARPKATVAAKPIRQASQDSQGDGIKLLVGAAIVIGTVAFLAWFLLN
ncbi:FHA domain-containing protein [Marinagarivorans algicola]|uniref:FHA domain-containing protein n=1 Tax=Marinagarivorans algicola TaxID=1513270 RepID=UPI0006B9C518|nr:FHA domain-containing protein [Marinagarivorans algicola]